MARVYKSFRPSQADVMRMKYLVGEKSSVSDVIRKTIEKVKENPPVSWKMILEAESGETRRKDQALSSPVTFLVDPETFSAVVESIRGGLEIQRVHTSLVVRLCLFAAYKQLRIEHPELMEKSHEITDLDVVGQVIEALKADHDGHVKFGIMNVINQNRQEEDK